MPKLLRTSEVPNVAYLLLLYSIAGLAIGGSSTYTSGFNPKRTGALARTIDEFESRHARVPPDQIPILTTLPLGGEQPNKSDLVSVQLCGSA